jgi:hypothetical protein
VEKRFAKLQRPHLPAPSPLLLGHSSLPFARLQTLKTLKTLQFPRGSFHQALWPSAFAVPALQPALCLHIALCCWGIQACRLPAFKRLKLKILPIPRGSCHQVLWPSAFAVPALQPALCVYIAFSKPSNCSNLQTPSRQLPPSTLYLDVMYGSAWGPKALLGIHCQLTIFAIYSNFLYLCVCFRSGFMHKETN